MQLWGCFPTRESEERVREEEGGRGGARLGRAGGNTCVGVIKEPRTTSSSTVP